MKDGTNTDLTHYPARAGNDDLIMLVNVPATEAQPFAWTAVTFSPGAAVPQTGTFIPRCSTM